MELAVNQFTKGLQVDTNPMVQGDDTLSDALNATFVTMNGNEVILLNDMGNRRVDHAFLPAGYEPVGIKEYGGVIYVASYNPITNRSQIGSFPSPERILSSLDNPDLGIESYAFSRFFKEPNIEEDIQGIKFLRNDEFMDLLTADTSLHAGDKFSIYSDYIWKKENQEYINQKYISHFNNWDKEQKKLISPKNKLFTLSVGVMNSLNEFVDITESLERFEESNGSNEIIKVENDALKLDDGYFIAPAKPTTKEEDIDRNLLAVNTYSYKLVGPLQLKTTLNHILNFDFVMDWQKGTSEENTSEEEGSTSGEESTSEEESTPKNLYVLIIRGIATYNCPDHLVSNDLAETKSEESPETTESETTVEEESSKTTVGEEGETENTDSTIPSERKEYAKRARFDILLDTQRTINEAFDSFDVYIKNSEKTKWAKLDDTQDNPDIKTILDVKTTYDINTDLYTSTITKKYTFTENEADDNHILLYYICVKALAEPYEEEGEEYNNIYLKNLSYQGEIDLTKIGSNLVKLKEYRYLYEPLDTDEGLATMTFFTEAYPDHFTEFSDFKILLELLVSNGGNSSWEPIDPDSYLYEAGTVLSGRVTFSFPTTLAQILYRVVFSYNKKSTIEKGLEEPIIIYRYLLTTELFNDCYYGSSGDYVEDYGLFMGTISEGLAPYTITYDGQPILTEVSEDLKKIRDNYLEVKLKLDGNIINKTAIPTLNTEGTFIIPNKGLTPDNISYRTTYSTILDLLYNYEVAINNLENYPTYIKLKSNTQIDRIDPPLKIDYTIEFVNQGIEEKGSEEYTNVLVAKVKPMSNSLSGNESESSTTNNEDPTEPSTTDPTEDSTPTTDNEGSTSSTDPTESSNSTTDLTETSTQKEYLGEKGDVSISGFEVTQRITYYDIFKAGIAQSPEKTFGTLYVDLNNVDIMKERLLPPLYSGFLVGSYGDSNHNFYTYIRLPSPIRTYLDRVNNLFSHSEENNPGGFIDKDNNYRMETALRKVASENMYDNSNFIFSIVSVEKETPKEEGSSYPVNDQYFIIESENETDSNWNSNLAEDIEEQGLSVPLPPVHRYYLDYYTMVFWKDNIEDTLYLLDTKPFKYRNLYQKTVASYTYSDIYNPDTLEVKYSKKIRRARNFYSEDRQELGDYSDRSETVNDEFYQNILDFIGITLESYKLSNSSPHSPSYRIPNWDALDLRLRNDYIEIEFPIKVECISGKSVIIQTGNKEISINFYTQGGEETSINRVENPPKKGLTIEAGWYGKVVGISGTTYSINTVSDIYAYGDRYSYVVPVSNYSPFENDLLFPDNNNYYYNHTYKLIGNVSSTTAYVTAELEEHNNEESDLLKLGLKNGQIILDTKSTEIILNTDSTFEESCNSILYDELLNDIYLETGEKVSRPGENKIYVFKNNKLKLINNPPFIYSIENNTIAFKNLKKLELTPSDFILKCIPLSEGGEGAGAGETLLPLKKIRVITKEMLDYHDGE